MKIAELLSKFINSRKIERPEYTYGSSELYGIMNEYTSAEEYLNPKPFNDESCSKMIDGIAMENMFEEILKFNDIPHKYQTNYTISCGSFNPNSKYPVLIECHPDFEFDNFIIETKSSDKPLDKLLITYQYQLEVQFRCTNKTIYLGKFSRPFNLELIRFIPSDKRWKKISHKIKKFNSQVCRLRKKQKYNQRCLQKNNLLTLIPQNLTSQKKPKERLPKILKPKGKKN